MAEVIIMPKLGFNMDEGQLVKWCKKEGEAVKKGEVLFEINTDKTTMPVEATTDGVVLKTMINEGDFAPVFTPIAVIGNEGEDVQADLNGVESVATADEVAKGEVSKEEEVAAPVEVKIDAKDLKLTPKAKKYIKDEGIDIETVKQVKGTGFEGGITCADIKASPLAKKLADKTGVDLSTVSGTGIGGKIMKEDVAKAAAQPANAGTDEMKVLKTVPYKGMRKIIGDRLSESKFTAPHLYFTDEINENSDVKISATDIMVLAATKALQKYPEINSSLVDGNIVTYKSCNVGVAVAGNQGLIVPVVKNAQEKSLTAIASETKDLFARARDGKLKQDEYSGGTFSISNLGMFGIGNFTAIINPPEAAILSISSTKKKPVVITNAEGEDEIVIRPMMNVQLTVDHRLIDGLLAAQFVAYMKELLENPIKILM